MRLGVRLFRRGFLRLVVVSNKELVKLLRTKPRNAVPSNKGLVASQLECEHNHTGNLMLNIGAMPSLTTIRYILVQFHAA